MKPGEIILYYLTRAPEDVEESLRLARELMIFGVKFRSEPVPNGFPNAFVSIYTGGGLANDYNHFCLEDDARKRAFEDSIREAKESQLAEKVKKS
jgi:hypothetical protein